MMIVAETVKRECRRRDATCPRQTTVWLAGLLTVVWVLFLLIPLPWPAAPSPVADPVAGLSAAPTSGQCTLKVLVVSAGGVGTTSLMTHLRRVVPGVCMNLVTDHDGLKHGIPSAAYWKRTRGWCPIPSDAGTVGVGDLGRLATKPYRYRRCGTELRGLPQRIIYVLGHPVLSLRSNFRRGTMRSVYASMSGTSIAQLARDPPTWLQSPQGNYTLFIPQTVAQGEDLIGFVGHMEAWQQCDSVPAPVLIASLDTLTRNVALLPTFLSVTPSMTTSSSAQLTIRAPHSAPMGEPRAFLQLYDELWMRMSASDGLVRCGNGLT